MRKIKPISPVDRSTAPRRGSICDAETGLTGGRFQANRARISADGSPSRSCRKSTFGLFSAASFRWMRNRKTASQASDSAAGSSGAAAGRTCHWAVVSGPQEARQRAARKAPALRVSLISLRTLQRLYPLGQLAAEVGQGFLAGGKDRVFIARAE